jgi:hypothetical protein
MYKWLNPFKTFTPARWRNVIYLSERRSLEYICIQILDILHDAYDTNERHAMITEDKIKATLALYTNWIVNVSGISQYETAISIEQKITHVVWEMLKPFNNQLVSVAIAAFLRNIKTENVRITDHVINDNCQRMRDNKRIICKYCNLKPLLTPSILYDQGSLDTNCAYGQVVENIIPNIPSRNSSENLKKAEIDLLNIFNFRAQINDDDSVYRVATIATCAEHIEHGEEDDVDVNTYDMALVGQIDISVNFGEKLLMNCILAYRGTDTEIYTENNTEYTICTFTFIFDRDRTITRAYNSARKINNSIITNWVNLCNSQPISPCELTKIYSYDTLRVYAELSSKHWGDLGLAFDGKFYPMNHPVTVITEDYMLQLICATFGVPYVYCRNKTMQDDDYAIQSIIHPSDVATDIIYVSSYTDISNTCPNFPSMY